MPGSYTCEMLALKYGVTSHNVRQALQAANVDIDAGDMIDVDAAEKADDKIKKFFADQEKERLASKQRNADWDDEKRKWLDAHNRKVASGQSKEGE